jgi:hypothetical protein
MLNELKKIRILPGIGTNILWFLLLIGVTELLALGWLTWLIFLN